MAEIARPTFEEFGLSGDSAKPKFEDFQPVRVLPDPVAKAKEVDEIVDAAIDINISPFEVISYPTIIYDPKSIGPRKQPSPPLSTVAPWLNTDIPERFRKAPPTGRNLKFEAPPLDGRGFWKWMWDERIVGNRQAPLPPNADRIEKVDRAVRSALGAPLRFFLKATKGLTLNTPDILWAALKRIVPEKAWDDEVRHMTLDEAMDWAAAYNPSGFEAMWGEVAEFAGRLNTIAPLAAKYKAWTGTERALTVLEQAATTALVFATSTATEQGAKFASEKIDPTETEYGYEGPTAVLRDMAIGAIFSLVHSGIKGAWSKLTPSEHARALKVLGLKKGATQAEITKAANAHALQTHPDKVKGLEQEFLKVIAARDTLRAKPTQDIIFRGQKVKFTPKLLEGEKFVAGKVVKPTEIAKKPPTAVAKPITKAKPTVTPPAEVVAPEAAQKPAEGKVKIEPFKTTPITEDDVTQIIKNSEKVSGPEYQMYMEDKIQAETTGDVEAARRAFDLEMAILGVDHIYNQDLIQWEKISPSELQRLIAAKAQAALPSTPKAEGKVEDEWAIINKYLAEHDASKGKIPAREPYLPTREEAFVAETISAGKGFKTQPSAIYPDRLEHAAEAIEIGEKLGYRPDDIAAYLKHNYVDATWQQMDEGTGPFFKPPAPPEVSEELAKPIDDLMRPGTAKVPQMRAVIDAGKKVWDTVLTFGEVRRTNPQLYDKLMKTYGKRSAAMETAINKLEPIMPKELSIEDDVLLATTYETKGREPPEHLKELYDKFSNILQENERAILGEGILSKPFQERMIEENIAKIETLKETLQKPSKSKSIQALVAENEKLKNMRYLPHTVVARNVIESKINRLPNDQRKAFLDRLSFLYKKRTGKMTLKDYLDAGIIDKDSVRMSRLAAQTIWDYQRRSAMKSLHDYATYLGLIQPSVPGSATTRGARLDGWLTPQEISIVSPELKGKLVHPLYAQALREMAAAKGGRGSLRREIFAMVKQGQFIKPTIIYTYNAVQKMFRGMYSLNPKTEASMLRQAAGHVLNRTPLYDTLNQDNLYQFPYEVSKATQEEQLRMWLNRHDPDIDRAIRYAETVTDTAWLDPNKSKKRFMRDMFMSVHRAVARITWLGDKIQRTQSYLINRKMGLSHIDAVKLAARSHGAYSELSRKYKDFMSKYFFVYSFRLLMPIEMIKGITEPLIEGAYKYAKSREIPSRPKVERWAKAVAASIAIPVLVDSYMRWRGFEPETHLGPVAWKYKKTVVVDGKEHELVVGLNYILNLPIKYWQRLTAYDPINPETRWMQAAKNVIKWEIHPVYRIFFWDISQNRRSFGAGQTVYDTEANPAVQLGQIMGYVMGQSFRFIGGFMDAAGEGKMTDVERERQEIILDEGLSKFDQVLFKTLGYNYIRLPLEERQSIAVARLRKEIFKRGIVYNRKYKDTQLDRKMAELERWAKKIQTWIEQDMR